MKYDKSRQEKQFFDDVNQKVVEGRRIVDIFETEYGLYVRSILDSEDDILDMVLVWDMNLWDSI